MMRKFILILLIATTVFGWGKIGHRTVGKIAEDHLSRKAKKEIKNLLGHTDLASISIWADNIRSDSAWDFSHDWHYTTIYEGQDYVPGENTGKAVEKIQEFIKILTNRSGSQEEQLIALKFLVHLLADIHQPLHVGNGTDRGGNDVKVTWFGEPTNLHRVWDSHMIDHQQLSYTEYAHQLQLQLNKDMIVELQSKDLIGIIKESRSRHPQVYDIGNGKLSWHYIYKNNALLEERLLYAGIRLAGILNDIYR